MFAKFVDHSKQHITKQNKSKRKEKYENNYNITREKQIDRNKWSELAAGAVWWASKVLSDHDHEFWAKSHIFSFLISFLSLVHLQNCWTWKHRHKGERVNAWGQHTYQDYEHLCVLHIDRPSLSLSLVARHGNINNVCFSICPIKHH